jgi:predicted alpha/beta hydrolase family esterase
MKTVKNALIMHGTDFDKDQKQSINNWFPWLKKELEKIDYKVWLPELPEAWHPDLNTYWNFLKDFNFNAETIVIGHSSGGAMLFGLLYKLPVKKKIKLAISVAGFYHDEGWNCEGLFSEPYDWEKIKRQAEKIIIIASDNDPYIKPEQTEYLSTHIAVTPTILHDAGHFNLEKGERFKQFPELLEIIKNATT